MRILIADDDMGNRIVLRALLADEHTLYEADSTETALDILTKQNDLDLILTDFSISTTNGGLKILTTARMSRAHAFVPVVLVTAHAIFGDRERFLRMGFDGYVEKPISRESIQEVLDKFATDESDHEVDGSDEF